MRGSKSTAGASDTHSTYGPTTRASGTSSQPPSSLASPSNIINVDEENGDGDDDGDAAEASLTSTSANRCRSVCVSASPTEPITDTVPTTADLQSIGLRGQLE